MTNKNKQPKLSTAKEIRDFEKNIIKKEQPKSPQGIPDFEGIGEIITMSEPQPSQEEWEKIYDNLGEYNYGTVKDFIRQTLASQKETLLISERDKIGQEMFRICEDKLKSQKADLKREMVERVGKLSCKCRCGCNFKDGCLCLGDRDGFNQALQKVKEEIERL